MKNLPIPAFCFCTILLLTGCTQAPPEAPAATQDTLTQASAPVVGKSPTPVAEEAPAPETSLPEDAITQAGTYTFTGTSEPIVIAATKEDDVEIILENVAITSTSQAPIHIMEAKDVTITLADNSTNTITDNRTSEEDTQDFPNAAIYSMADLKIEGGENATLAITANLNDGITTKDDLDIRDAQIEVTAADDGIIGKDSIEVENSMLIITAGGDALKTDNYETEGKGFMVFTDSAFTITAGDDAVHAVTSLDFISGTLDILASYEGLESQTITIDGGVVNIVAEDDGINIAYMGYQTEEEKAAKAARSASKLERVAREEAAQVVGAFATTDEARPARGERPTGGRGPNDGGGGGGGGGNEPAFAEGLLVINGGTLMVNAGGDGLDSNGSMVINGGDTTVEGPTTSVEGALDANDEFIINGGTLLAVGSVGMAQMPEETSTQPTLQLNLETLQSAGTTITLQDESGTEIFTYTPTKVFQSITYSSPDLVQGMTYSLLVNDAKVLDITLDGMTTQYGEGERARGGGR